MIKQYIAGDSESKPDSKAFLDVIQAWARSGHAGADEHIRKLTHLQSEIPGDLESVDDGRNHEKDDLGELVKMLSTAVDKRDADLAERLLMDAVKQKDQGSGDVRITHEHYQAVITAWSKTKGAKSLDRTMRLFHEMMNRYDSGDKDLRPTERGYSAVISAIERSGRDDRGQMAQNVFDNMVGRFEAGEESLRPSVVSYTALIKAWAAAGRPDRAEHVLLQMHEAFTDGNDAAKPNERSFNIVLSAWSKDSSEEALERATKILGLMKDLGDSQLQLNPDTVSFASAIACCIKSDAALRVDLAESFFQEARDRYAAGDKACKPNCMIYGAVIQTIARSDVEDAAERAESYLKEMLTLDDFDARQILLSHNAVMGAWSKHSDKMLALEKSESLLGNLIKLSQKHQNKGCLPNKYTYSQLLNVLWKSGASDKLQRLQAILTEMKSLRVKADSAIERVVAKFLDR